MTADPDNRCGYESKRAQIEDILAALYQAYDDLFYLQTVVGQEHNSMVTIHKLPTETLSSIFEHVIDFPRDDFDSEPTAMSISKVCSRWRSIAITCPILWSKIDFDELSPRIAQLFLDRAGLERPLQVDALNPFIFSTHRDMLYSRIHFIDHISIHILNTNPSFDNSLTPPYPPSVLSFLLSPPSRGPLRITSFSWNVQCYMDCIRDVLGISLFGGVTWTPRLQHMKLQGIRFPWKRGFYSNLRTLEISGFTFHTVIFQEEDICNVLLDCPHLGKLVLRTATPYHFYPFEPILSTADSSVYLSDLYHLDLHLPIFYITHILRSLAVNNIASIYISFPHATPTIAMETLGLPAITSHAAFADAGAFDVTLGWNFNHLSCNVMGYITHQDVSELTFRFCGDIQRPIEDEELEQINEGYCANVLRETCDGMRPLIPVLRTQCLRIPGLLRAHEGPVPSSRILLPCTTLELHEDAFGFDFYNAELNSGAVKDRPELRNLHVVSTDALNRAEVFRVVRWCKHQGFIENLRFESVTVCVSSQEEFDELIEEVQGLLDGITVVWDNDCIYSDRGLEE